MSEQEHMGDAFDPQPWMGDDPCDWTYDAGECARHGSAEPRLTKPHEFSPLSYCARCGLVESPANLYEHLLGPDEDER